MATIKLDCRGMACPLPIIKTSMAVKKGASGDIFEITCDDPAFEQDIRAWCRETGNAIINVTKAGKDTVATVSKK